MRVGDVLEWLAAAAFITAAYLWHGVIPAVLVAGVFLAYEAQCYSEHTITIRPPRIKRRPDKNEGP